MMKAGEEQPLTRRELPGMDFGARDALAKEGRQKGRSA
jgi:hypothetical protein